MTDISKKDRIFQIYFDKNVVGVASEYVDVNVPAGEDADVICASVLQEIINDETYSGWDEKEQADD